MEALSKETIVMRCAAPLVVTMPTSRPDSGPIRKSVAGGSAGPESQMEGNVFRA
jgi:hypothetical protein